MSTSSSVDRSSEPYINRLSTRAIIVLSALVVVLLGAIIYLVQLSESTIRTVLISLLSAVLLAVIADGFLGAKAKLKSKRVVLTGSGAIIGVVLGFVTDQLAQNPAQTHALVSGIVLVDGKTLEAGEVTILNTEIRTASQAITPDSHGKFVFSAVPKRDTPYEFEVEVAGCRRILVKDDERPNADLRLNIERANLDCTEAPQPSQITLNAIVKVGALPMGAGRITVLRPLGVQPDTVEISIAHNGKFSFANVPRREEYELRITPQGCQPIVKLLAQGSEVVSLNPSELTCESDRPDTGRDGDDDDDDDSGPDCDRSCASGAIDDLKNALSRRIQRDGDCQQSSISVTAAAARQGKISALSTSSTGCLADSFNRQKGAFVGKKVGAFRCCNAAFTWQR